MSRLFLPAATNYITNPGFRLDSNADGFADSYQEGLITNVTRTYTIVDRVINGVAVKAMKVRWVAGAGVSAAWTQLTTPSSAVGSFSQNDYATISAYVKVTEISGVTAALGVQTRDAAEGVISTQWASPALTAVDSDFVRRSISYQCVEATTSRASFVLSCLGNFDTGDVIEFEIAMVQLEKSPFQTPYFDGSSSDSLNASTYAWTGTANASTSTRAASVLRLPYTVGASGTIAMRWVPTFIQDAAASLYATDESGMYLWYSGVAPRISFLGGGTPSYCAGANETWAAGAKKSLTARWDAATHDLMSNGVSATQTARTGTTAGTVFNLLLAQKSYAVGPLLLSSQRKSDAWVTAMDTLLRASVVDLPAIKRMMAPGDALFTGEAADASNLYVKGS